MLLRLIGCMLALALLGGLMTGCSDDTQRVTTRGGTIVSDPLATDVGDSETATDVFPYESYWLWDTAVVGDESGTTATNPWDRFTTTHDSRKPVDVGSDTE